MHRGPKTNEQVNTSFDPTVLFLAQVRLLMAIHKTGAKWFSERRKHPNNVHMLTSKCVCNNSRTKKVFRLWKTEIIPLTLVLHFGQESDLLSWDLPGGKQNLLMFNCVSIYLVYFLTTQNVEHQCLSLFDRRTSVILIHCNVSWSARDAIPRFVLRRIRPVKNTYNRLEHQRMCCVWNLS